MRSAVKHRSKQRLRALAHVVANRAWGKGDWDQAEEAARIADELVDLDLAILQRVSEVQIRDGVFANTQTVTVEPVHLGLSKDEILVTAPPILSTLLPGFEITQLQISVSKLTMLGLLKDEGVGRWSTSGSQYFSLTQSGIWFLEWIRLEPTIDAKYNTSSCEV